MWKGVLYLKKKGSVVWGVSFFSENKQCVLLPSLLRKADTASVPDLVLRNSSYYTNGKSLKRQLPQLCVLPGPFPWQGVGVSCVLWCVWFLSVLWTVREEDSTTDRPCSVPFGDRDPPAGRTWQHQSSQGAPGVAQGSHTGYRPCCLMLSSLQEETAVRGGLGTWGC